MLKQLSVFLENSPGRMAKMVRTLGDANINLHVLVVADTVDYGVARLICRDPERAVEVLRGAGLSATLTDVVAVEIDDRPGALADLVEFLADRGFSIEYAYTYVEPTTGRAVNVCRLDDQARAERELRDGGYTTLDNAQVY